MSDVALLAFCLVALLLARVPVAAGDIEPWVAADSVAIFKLLCWGAGASIEAAAVLDRLTQRLGGVGARPRGVARRGRGGAGAHAVAFGGFRRE